MSRTVSWFSCGAASAVATKLASMRGPVEIVRIEVKEEHSDNERFHDDCQKWFGQEIITIGNDNYGRSTDEVFYKTQFLVGPSGARCTAELKKAMRWEFSEPDDINILGYTVGEEHRTKRLQKSEPMTKFWPILQEEGLSKEDCLALVDRVGIELPVMYQLGYGHNNCIGCVKGQSGYWNKIRRDFPERFNEMAQIERELGRTICKREWTDADGERQLERIFLDELPEHLGTYDETVDIECGMFCQMAEQDMAA